MQEAISLERELHRVGAHIASLDDADARNGDSFGVTLMADQEDFIGAISSNTADNSFSPTDFQGLNSLGNSAHQRDLFGGEGETEDACAGGGDDDFALVAEGGNGVEFIVFAELDDGGASVGKST